MDTDMVVCKVCSEQLLVKLDDEDQSGDSKASGQDDDNEKQDEGEEEADLSDATAIKYQLLVDKYSQMIVTAHSQSCPWRNRGCDESIQRISGLFNTSSALQALKSRYESLRIFDIPSVHIPREHFSYKLANLAEFRFRTGDTQQAHQDILRLAMCGWQASTGRGDVAECRACFRSLGLWLYRGEAPIMEKLDAVESHLEYCPWRSPSAQQSELELEGEKMMVPAWFLVARRIDEHIYDRLQLDSSPARKQQHHKESEGLGEKERETRVKELLRRVKQLKKPFNVKSLLRKKPAAG